MSYYPRGNGGTGTLLTIGFILRQAEFADVAIPKLEITKNWQTLPGTILLRTMTNFDGNVVESVGQEMVFTSGFEYVFRQGSPTRDKPYGPLDQWYGVVKENRPTIRFAKIDGSNPFGFYHVGAYTEPYNSNDKLG